MDFVITNSDLCVVCSHDLVNRGNFHDKHLTCLFIFLFSNILPRCMAVTHISATGGGQSTEVNRTRACSGDASLIFNLTPAVIRIWFVYCVNNGKMRMEN